MMKPTVSCMLCESGTEADLDNPLMAGEPKLDGTRVWAGKTEGEPWVFNRKGVDYSDRLTEVSEALKGIASEDIIIDGEAVVYIGGRSIFNASQRRCSTQDAAKQRIYETRYPIIVEAFDIVRLDGKDTTGYTWETRRRLLEDILMESLQSIIRPIPYRIEGKRELFDEVVARKEEGLILKAINSPYVGRRSKYWLKVKRWYHERCRVVGYTDGSGKRNGYFGSLILAQPDDDGILRYVGKVGTGFNNAELEKVAMLLLDTEEPDEPLVDARNANGKPVPYTPVNFDLEVTVKFYETSERGVFRFPSLLKEGGANLIHYNSDTLGGTISPKQTDLKKLLERIAR